MGGGNKPRPLAVNAFEGLSPRGRGKPRPMPKAAAMRRSIPAWAGETASAVSRRCPAEVYPRVGGGNSAAGNFEQSSKGLSPRGRGKQTHFPAVCWSARSIPAWAGETDTASRRHGHQRVYPRVGGGNGPISSGRSHAQGLSPRGRGKPAPPQARRCAWRSIPAWAGETQSIMSGAPMSRVYPRVGGGNPKV